MFAIVWELQDLLAQNGNENRDLKQALKVHKKWTFVFKFLINANAKISFTANQSFRTTNRLGRSL